MGIECISLLEICAYQGKDTCNVKCTIKIDQLDQRVGPENSYCNRFHLMCCVEKKYLVHHYIENKKISTARMIHCVN